MKLGKIKFDNIEYNLSNIVVVIGPNNAGKTKLLTDLHFEVSNSYERTQDSDYVSVATGAASWTHLTDKNYFEFSIEELTYWLDNHEEWREAQNSTDRGQKLLRSKKHILQQQNNDEAIALIQSEIDTIKNNPNQLYEWLVKFKKSHIIYETIDNRFNTANILDSIDASSDDNPSLIYARSDTIRGINKHLVRLFAKVLVLLKLSKTIYGLMLIDEGQTNLPKWAKSNNFEADAKTVKEHNLFKEDYPHGVVSQQSHGTRAAVSILMTLADKTRSVVFIDEPESHIYPAARKYIARLIASESKNRQFFIVTHDVDFLEGIANSRKDFTVIKLTRKREAKVIDFNTVERRRTSSELKNSAALRAGFYDVAIFVEGIQDKYMYDYVVTRKQLISDEIEYGIIDCGGNDRIADSVKFALDIGTRVAVITDFDTLLLNKDGAKKPARVEKIIMTLGYSIPVNLQKVQSIMRNRPNATKGVRAGSLSDDNIRVIGLLLTELQDMGIFVVPCGELYDWFSAMTKEGVAVEDLRGRFYKNSSRYSELTDFLTTVSTYASKS